MNVGENIKRIRKEKGITQKELGEKLGVSQSAIGQFESCNSNLKTDTIIKIADALGVSPTRLILEIPFCSGSKEERSKMSIEELAEYLTYSLTDNEDVKKDILKRVEDRKKNTKEKSLLDNYQQLNDSGQDKAIEQVEMLTKIPEYRKDTNTGE